MSLGTTSIESLPNEIGKNNTPAPNVMTPKIGRSNCEILAGPIILAVIKTVTKAAIIRS